MKTNKGLEFEQPIYDLESQIEQLATEDETGNAEQLRGLRRDLAQRTKEIYGSLSAWQKVRVARHPDRPHTADYLSLCLLYTSPSPRDLSTSRMPSSA